MQDSMCGSLTPVKKPVVPLRTARPFHDDDTDLGGFGGSAGAGAGPLDAEGMVVEDYLESSSLSSWIDELLHEPPGASESPRNFPPLDESQSVFPGYDTPELDMADQAAGEPASSEIRDIVCESEKKVSSSQVDYGSAELSRNLENPLEDNVAHQQLPRTAEQPPAPLTAAREALSNLLKRISAADSPSRRVLESQASIPGNSHTGHTSIDILKSSIRGTSSASDALFSLQSQNSVSSGNQIRIDGRHNRSLVGSSDRSFTQSWPVSKVLGIARKSSASSLPVKFADASLASGSRSGIHHFSAPAHSPPLPAKSFSQSHYSSTSAPLPVPTLQQLPLPESKHIPIPQTNVTLPSLPAFASNPVSSDNSFPETIAGAFLSSPSQRKQHLESGGDFYDGQPFGNRSPGRGVAPLSAGFGSHQRFQKSHLSELGVSDSHSKTRASRYNAQTKSSTPWVLASNNSTGSTEPLDQAARTKDKAESQAQNGLRLVQLLLECAEAVSKHEIQLAQGMLLQLQKMVSTSGDSMQRVAACFTEALHARLLSTGSQSYAALRACDPASSDELLAAYQILYQACPYIKFAHFTSNQAIFEAFEGEPRVHIVDLDIVQGYQWPALMQALAARRGGPPTLRITGVGVPLESVQETGKRLSELAECLHISFSFHAIGKRLEDVKDYMLQPESGEALAFNSVNRLHRLLTDQRTLCPLIDILRMIYERSPKIVTIVEQEASHNGHTFLSRFLEALHYYSAIFDSLEATLPRVSPERTKVEQLIFAREITNIIACEGTERVERHEKVERWRRLLESNGFKNTAFSTKAFDQSRVLLGLYPCDGYTLVEDNGCILLGWQDRPVFLVGFKSWTTRCMTITGKGAPCNEALSSDSRAELRMRAEEAPLLALTLPTSQRASCCDRCVGIGPQDGTCVLLVRGRMEDGLQQQTMMRQRTQRKRQVAVVESSAGKELPLSEWIEVADNVQRKYELGRRKESKVVGRVLKDTRPAVQKVVDSFLGRFFPLGYPHSVAEGYLTYSQYRAVQHFASAVLSVFSTQSLLFAAGLRPTPAQATIVSWVLKDGMQHIGKFVCSSLGTRMDSEPKRWRIFADVMYDVGAGLEVVAPFCPQYFLEVAGLANMAKGMALVSARATRLPVYSAFAKEGNLSDLYAKGEAISTLSNVLGLGVGIHLASTACASIEAKLLVAPVLSAVHLYCVAQEMRAAPINTLNAQRTALLVADFVRTGQVSEPAQLRHRERLVLPIGLNREAGNVRVGTPLQSSVAKPSKLLQLKHIFPKEKFLLNFHDKCTDLVLHQSATGEDAVKGWLLAAFTSKLAGDSIAPEHLPAALEKAYMQVESLFPSFLSGLKEKGWHTHLFLEGSGIRAVW